METGFVCVVSSLPGCRAEIANMAARLYKVDAATQRDRESGSMALHVCSAPWQAAPMAESAAGDILLLLGQPWRGAVRLNAEAMLRRWLNAPERVVADDLGGAFGVLVWSPKSSTLTLISDRIGTQKIYLWQTHDCILVGTGLAALLAHSRVMKIVDSQAVAEFLAGSYVISTRSLIKDIGVLTPATRYTLGLGNDARAQRWWRPQAGRGTDDGLDAWAGRLGEVLCAAVQPRLADHYCLPVTGGLDSRALAACLPVGQSAVGTTVTFGPGWCLDVRYGRRIARALSLPHRRLGLPADFFSRYLEFALATCDGEISLEALPMLRLLDAAKPGDTMLNGYLGDVLSEGHMFGLPPGLPFETGVGQVWEARYRKKGFSFAQLSAVLLPERLRELDPDLQAPLREAMADADADTLDEKTFLADLALRQSRYVSYMLRVLGTRYRVECPFLDREVLDTFLALPLAWRRDQRAYRRMLVQRSPALAALPEIKTHRPVAWADQHGLTREPAAAGRSTGHWRVRAMQRAWERMLVRVSGGWLGDMNRDHYVVHADNARRVAPEWFRQRLLHNPTVDGWFDRRALAVLLDEHLARKQDHSTRLNNLVAFIAWLEAMKL